jgi:hypothetical protein
MFIVNSKVLSNSRLTNLLETLKVCQKKVPERCSGAFSDKKKTLDGSILDFAKFQILKLIFLLLDFFG